MWSNMFCVHYTPADKPIDVKYIPWKLIRANSMKSALAKFNTQYPNSRALYVTKV